MSQNALILAHLKKGYTITQMEALSMCGCFRLASRISELRSQGNIIETRFITKGDKRYAEYRLINK